MLYCWIDILATEIRDGDFKATARILGEADFVGWRAAGHVDSVALANKGSDGAWRCPNTGACESACMCENEG